MVRQRFLVSLFLVAAVGLSQALADPATPLLPDNPPTLTELELEVEALHHVYHFQFTKDQLKKLRKLTQETVPELVQRRPGKASDDYRQALLALRDALARDEVDTKILELQEKIVELTEQEKPEADLALELTEAARRRAPEVLRLLSTRQVAHYVASFSNEIHDPRERLVAALDEVRGLDKQAWKKYRERRAEEVSRGVAGLDAAKAAKVSDQVLQLLIEVRSLSDLEIRIQRADLERQAGRIVGTPHPLEVIRNTVEVALAELLSNPRVETALAARLKEQP